MEGIDDNLKYLNELIQEVDSTAASRAPVPAVPAVVRDASSAGVTLVLPEIVVPYVPSMDVSGVVEDRVEDLELEHHTDEELYEEFKLVWEIRHQCSTCDISKSKSELSGFMKKSLYTKLFDQTEKDLQVIHSEYVARGLPIPEAPPAPLAPTPPVPVEEEDEPLSVKPPPKKGKKSAKEANEASVVAVAVDMETGKPVTPE